MSLLKVFVCQVILLGTYKLFLEHIFEDYLVPDELTRNCLVGFICLLCFGIQLYTDKAADEDSDGTGEDLKSTCNSGEAATTKKYESTGISVTRDTIGSNASSQRMVTKTETTSQGGNSFSSAKDQRVTDSAEKISVASRFDTEKAPLVTNAGIFSQFSTNIPDPTTNVEVIEQEHFASNVQTSYKQETTISASNGLSETVVCEESDEDEIEIDHFETKESVKEAEPLISTKVEETELSETIVCEESDEDEIEIDQFETKESVKEAGTLVFTEVEETEELLPEPVTDTAGESECLISNGESISSTQDLETTILRTDELEADIMNGTVEDSLNNNIDGISQNKIEETESKKSEKDENEIVNRQEIVLSQIGKSTKDNIESLPSNEDVTNTSSVLTQPVNSAEMTNKNNAETTTLVKTAVSSTISKIKAGGDVCVAPVTIDISFIYACH